MFPNSNQVVDTSFFINCSKFQEHHWVNDVDDFTHYNLSLAKSRIVTSNTLDLVLVVGVCFAVAMYAAINIEDLTIRTTLAKLLKNKNIARLSVLFILALFSPIFISMILLALFHKVLCYFIIVKSDKNFISFLDGFDVFWSLEDNNAGSLINVLGVIETTSPEYLVEKIKQKLETVVSNETSSKVFYRRRERYGWYYWKKYDSVNLDEYVKLLIVGNKNYITKHDMENVMTQVAYQPLPFNDEGLFQILVTKQTINEIGEESGNYGIIFRIHHSVGDGVALIEFLCQALADEVGSYQRNTYFTSGCHSSLKDDFKSTILTKIKYLCSAPICFVDGIIRKPDEHSLHGPVLSGKKLFKWTDPDENLFQMIRDIKQQNKDLNFSDVLATSLSAGLRNYFDKTMDYIPEDVAVILPIRLPDTSEPSTRNIHKFNNNFTVTILDLPIKRKRPVKEIRRRCALIRKSVDPMVNHYFLKMCYLLPQQILRPIFKSSQATLTFSNMPGPQTLSICGGDLIKSLVFFIPNKGTTGLGISALCYGGVLRFSAMADANIVPSSDHLSLILDGMVDEIKHIHALHVKK